VPTYALIHVKRFLRTRRAWGAVLAWLLLAIAIGLAAGAKSTGISGALVSTHANTALPFLAYAVVGGIVSPKGMGASVWNLGLLGLGTRRAATSLVLAALGMGAFFGLISSALICFLGHGAMDPPLAHDLFVTSWVGALAGAAYGALFMLGSSFFRGAGRAAIFALDWILGSSGVFALFLPHGHVASLFGGEPAFEMSQRQSSIALVLIAVLASLWAVRRGSRAR
jgi:hypothetical protein